MTESSIKGWIITGRVQGVGFRYFVKDKANRLGLRGYVENLSSLSDFSNTQVRVVAQGDPAALDSLVDALQKGPPGSQVDRVESISLDRAEGADGTIFDGFVIRR